jgi:hypothetical protein
MLKPCPHCGTYAEYDGVSRAAPATWVAVKEVEPRHQRQGLVISSAWSTVYQWVEDDDGFPAQLYRFDLPPPPLSEEGRGG